MVQTTGKWLACSSMTHSVCLFGVSHGHAFIAFLPTLRVSSHLCLPCWLWGVLMQEMFPETPDRSLVYHLLRLLPRIAPQIWCSCVGLPRASLGSLQVRALCYIHLMPDLMPVFKKCWLHWTRPQANKPKLAQWVNRNWQDSFQPSEVYLCWVHLCGKVCGHF